MSPAIAARDFLVYSLALEDQCQCHLFPRASAKQFAEKFREGVRVGLDWDRFLAEDWPVELVTITSAADLERCFVPWYIDAKAAEVAYDHAEAVPMSLADVPKAFAILNVERRADIQDKVERMRGESGPVKFSAPTYALPDDQYFVLDRNHRLSALAVEHVPFEVTLWNILGPLDPNCLLDLTHWSPPRRLKSP